MRYGKYALMVVALLIFAACGREAVSVEEITPRVLPDSVEMFFIYEESCANCDGTAEFYEIVAERLSEHLHLHPNTIHTINIFGAGNMQQFRNIAYDLLYVDAETLQLPVLIVNGLAFQGMDAIRANIGEAFLTAGHDLFVNEYVFNPRYMLTGDRLFDNFTAHEDHLTLVYFYRMVCPACIEIEPLIQNLPEMVEIDGRQVPVDLIRINTRSGNNRDRVLAFFEAFDVPNQERFVPIIFTAAGNITGPEAIAEFLTYGLGQADQVGLQLP